MARLVLFNKPYGVLSQFSGSPPGSGGALADYLPLPGIYPAGRLDKDSEGLLLLTDDGGLQHRISHPRHKEWKTYWVQIEGTPEEEQLAQLRQGVMLNDGPTKPARAKRLMEPDLWPRDPPVRFRKRVPTAWIEIGLREGRNRQIRRMTAAVGLPTLRLVRVAIGQWRLDDLDPGQYRVIQVASANGTERRARSRGAKRPQSQRPRRS
ncbi:pseudouridine synthase [Imhoffiella purpurea]|uniref:Pseudouridine synthase n=1 Tax=Imhoffiella purpurea TaxID=1249627 RepID=W9V7Q9_9GAMM|nr:pseudouridine synthase [Imhoffiella purpurea]EXJ15459.1 Ribosomal large subunit pseudouridine synthase E [Imhoffiella purpurea]